VSTTPRKVDLFGVGISVTDYEEAASRIIDAAARRESFAMTALATHGLTEAVRDPGLRAAVAGIDLVTPDGQPVRWAMNALHGTGLRERVYGPALMGHVCERAAREGVGLYLFGSTPETCQRLTEELPRRYPGLRIVAVQPDRFREATPAEDAEDVERMNASGAGVVLVGRGCPRQERWVAAHRGKVNASMMAVGAAFDYYAGNIDQPPAWMQQRGLEWLFRLTQDPKRLWRRYLLHNTLFCWYFAQALLRRARGASVTARG